MTVLDRPVAAPPGGMGPPPGGAPEAGIAAAKVLTRRSPAYHVARTAVLILSAALLGFALYVGLISSLHHARAQHDAYADFRRELAQATAPTGQTQLESNPTDKPKLLKLGTPVAVLYIPKLHVREVVFEGTTASILQDGPGHLRSTPLPGQLGISEIMGRSAAYGGPFGHLARLSPGDILTVTTGQGVNLFRVRDVRREGDPKPAPLAIGKSRLLLATADGIPLIPSGVLRVDADLISPVRPTPAAVLNGTDLPAAEQAMGTETFAWVPLVLWGQGLVLMAGLISWARAHWGRWQTWIVAVPVLLFFGLAVADQATRLLPNLM